MGNSPMKGNLKSEFYVSRTVFKVQNYNLMINFKLNLLAVKKLGME